MVLTTLNKTFKYRLYPNKSQIEILNKTLDICRYLYNCALQERRDAWIKNKISLNSRDQAKELIECKKVNEDLNLVSSQALQEVLRRLDKSFKNFFRRIKTNRKTSYPRFKSKDRYNSITYFEASTTFYIQQGKLHLPKILPIRIHLHRSLEGKTKQLIIKRSSTNKWYACFVVEIEKEVVQRKIKNKIGIDMGLSSFLTTSNGEKIDNPRYLKVSQDKLSKEQRRLSRKIKGSNSRKKQKLVVAKVHEKIVNQRLDFQHKLSRQFVNKYDLISHEDLKVDKMVQNKLFSKSISDTAWGRFLTMLNYKAEEAGCSIVKVDPKNTSQLCSSCGKLVPKELSERIHHCNYCGLELDRDVNAAKNILRIGQELSKSTPMKRRRLSLDEIGNSYLRI